MYTSTLWGVLTCMRSSACSSVLTVVPALVDIAPVPSVARLAATLGHLASVKEAAPAVQTLDITGLRGRSCGDNSMVMNVGSESKPPRVCIKFVTLKQICFGVSLPPGVTVPAYRLQHIDKTRTKTKRLLDSSCSSASLITSGGCIQSGPPSLQFSTLEADHHPTAS